MTYPVKFQFQAGSQDGKFMDLTVTAGDHTLYHGPAQEDFSVSGSVEFPAHIRFEFCNKQAPDQFIELKSVTLGRVQFESWKIPTDVLNYRDIREQFQNTWWAQNGTADLMLDDPDPVSWLLDHPQTLN